MSFTNLEKTDMVFDLWRSPWKFRTSTANLRWKVASKDTSRFTNHCKRCAASSQLLPELVKEIPLAIRWKMWYLHGGAPPHYVQNAAQAIRENRGFLNRILLPWTRRVVLKSLHYKRWQVFRATSLMFHFILLLTITVFLLCCSTLCCFLNKLQALFYHHFTNFSKSWWWKHNLEWYKNLTF
jgi:hypothetical protein